MIESLEKMATRTAAATAAVAVNATGQQLNLSSSQLLNAGQSSRVMLQDRRLARKELQRWSKRLLETIGEFSRQVSTTSRTKYGSSACSESALTASLPANSLWKVSLLTVNLMGNLFLRLLLLIWVLTV